LFFVVIFMQLDEKFSTSTSSLGKMSMGCLALASFET